MSTLSRAHPHHMYATNHTPDIQTNPFPQKVCVSPSAKLLPDT